MIPWNIVFTIIGSWIIMPVSVLAEQPDTARVYLFSSQSQDGAGAHSSMAFGQRDRCLRMLIPSSSQRSGPTKDSTSMTHDEMIFCETPEPRVMMVNHPSRTYTTMTSAQFDELRQLMNDSGHSAARPDNNEPDPEAVDMEAYFKVDATVTNTGKRSAAEDIPCEWYIHELTGFVQSRWQICVAEWSDLPDGKRAGEIFHAWSEFMAQFSTLSPLQSNPWQAMDDVDGFPLIRQSEDANGTVGSTERYTGTRTETMSFAPPKDYVQADDAPFAETPATPIDIDALLRNYGDGGAETSPTEPSRDAHPTDEPAEGSERSLDEDIRAIDDFFNMLGGMTK